MKLQNLATLITGGSRGLGRALGATLASAGAKVVLVARRQESLDETVAWIRSQGGEAHGIVADVADKTAIYPIAGQATDLVGPIDLLINNASTLGPTPMPLLLDTECEDFEQVLQTNLVAPLRLSKVIVGSMVLRGQGMVLNISSDAAVESYPEWGAYSVSKAALDHLTRIWASELHETGVRFYSLDPGEMNTIMHALALPDADPDQLADPLEVASNIGRFIADPIRFASGARIVLEKEYATNVREEVQR